MVKLQTRVDVEAIAVTKAEADRPAAVASPHPCFRLRRCWRRSGRRYTGSCEIVS